MIQQMCGKGRLEAACPEAKGRLDHAERMRQSRGTTGVSAMATWGKTPSST